MTHLESNGGYAKRKHRTHCQVTGLPILPGDRYCTSTYVESGEFHRFKGLQIICDVVQEAWKRYDWLDYEAPAALWDWLIERLPEDEARGCLDAAMAYWRGNRL